MFRLLFLLFFTLSTVQTTAASSVKINVKQYGAKGDGKTLNTIALNNAIEACAKKGGGTVVFPAGIYLTGTINMKSHVSLYIEKDAVIKGISDLNEYESFIPSKDMDKYHGIDTNWCRALILGMNVDDITISGDGIIDGDHVFDPNGEENMRGPHAIIFGESRNITISNIIIERAANYGFMAYEIENVIFQNLTVKEGWDGIHIRGGKNIIIRNSNFFTGDDAIAGGYWSNMVITDCYINSSCNGVRLIMPAVDLVISHCTFKGAGEFPHRTSKELKRNDMLSAILLQPGGWRDAPGKMENVHIHDLTIENLENPLMVALSKGNEAGNVLIERIKASRISKSALSVESWNGDSFWNVTFKDIEITYDGHNDPGLNDIVATKPHVDSRMLPCWGLFGRNVKNLVFENIEISFMGEEYRPAFYFDNVANITFTNVKYKQSHNKEAIIMNNSGEIKGNAIASF